MNALSGNTPLFAEVDGKYGVYTLKELYELHNQWHRIKVPALLDEHGNVGWIDVEDVVSFGKQRMKRITLTTTRLVAELTEDAIIHAFSHHLFEVEIEKINLKFKFVNELKITQDPRRNDTIFITTRIPLNIPEGDEKDYDYGFALGFFVAEGTFHYRKRKNTKQSLANLNRYAKQKGMTVEEYLNHTTDIRQVQLAAGQMDFERGYVDILRKHFKFSKPSKVSENGYQLYSSDLKYIHLIKDYTEGETSHNKHIKNDVYNRSWKFLEGILNGFLAGDGHFRKEQDLFEVEITTNYKLRDDLIFLSKALGYDAHINNGYFAKSPSSNNYYYKLRLSIFKNFHRHIALGLAKEYIKSIEDVGEREAYNLVLKSLYSKDDKRVKFNHLYFSAFGFLVSDAVKTFTKPLLLPEIVHDHAI